jgi:hypothetical protein
MKIHHSFYEGRTPPKVHPKSMAYVEWWARQVDRCVNGYSYGGYTITGWHYFMINFFKIELWDPVAQKVTVGLPYWSQEDDRLFKMIQEAELSALGVLLLTARGYGKSYVIAVIFAHMYTFIPGAKGIISSSIEKPSKDLFEKIDFGLTNLPKPLRHNRLIDLKGESLMAGMRFTENGEEKKKGFMSKLDRLTYGDNPGKSRGTRPLKQAFEEIGAWTGSAGLIECYDQSRGSFFRGSVMTGQPLLIGTGGQMKSGATKDAKAMYYDPEAYNLYAIDMGDGKKKSIFIPAYKKLTGFYEFKGDVKDKDGVVVGHVPEDGISDEIGARAALEKRRKKLENKPASYSQEIQEYPFNEQEMFTVNGTNRFNQLHIARQSISLDNMADSPVERGHLEWVRDATHKIQGVEWIADKQGPIEIVKGEHPRLDAFGKVYLNLYIGGLDSIDQGKADSMSESGSQLSLMIKKRFLSMEDTDNMYVCKYTDRPEKPETAFENVLKVLWYYNCRVNLEYTKISIVPYFKIRRQYWRFVQRPAIALADMNSTRFTSLIGTQMVPKIIQHMNLKLQALVEDECHKLLFRSTLTQLRDYDPDNQTEFDEVVAMGLCELADEDMVELTAIAQRGPQERIRSGWGYYRDPVTGYKRYGKLPDYSLAQQEFNYRRPATVRYLDAQSQAAEYYPTG